MEKGVISRQSNQDQTIISVTTMYQEMQKTLKTKKTSRTKIKGHRGRRWQPHWRINQNPVSSEYKRRASKKLRCIQINRDGKRSPLISNRREWAWQWTQEKKKFRTDKKLKMRTRQEPSCVSKGPTVNDMPIMRHYYQRELKAND